MIPATVYSLMLVMVIFSDSVAVDPVVRLVTEQLSYASSGDKLPVHSFWYYVVADGTHKMLSL